MLQRKSLGKNRDAQEMNGLTMSISRSLVKKTLHRKNIRSDQQKSDQKNTYNWDVSVIRKRIEYRLIYTDAEHQTQVYPEEVTRIAHEALKIETNYKAENPEIPPKKRNDKSPP